jgi:hypothetical protein
MKSVPSGWLEGGSERPWELAKGAGRCNLPDAPGENEELMEEEDDDEDRRMRDDNGEEERER